MRVLVPGLFLSSSGFIVKVFQRLFDRCLDLTLVITLDCEWLVITVKKINVGIVDPVDLLIVP
jgi:hypothetical protein